MANWPLQIVWYFPAHRNGMKPAGSAMEGISQATLVLFEPQSVIDQHIIRFLMTVFSLLNLQFAHGCRTTRL